MEKDMEKASSLSLFLVSWYEPALDIKSLVQQELHSCFPPQIQQISGFKWCSFNSIDWAGLALACEKDPNVEIILVS
jgi:hypothetical protein